MSRKWPRYVYLLHSAGIYKIGSSMRPEDRARLAGPGGKLLHDFYSANAFRIERALHHALSGCRDDETSRFGREWFRLDDAIVQLICGIERADTVAELPPELQPPLEDAACCAWIHPELLRKAEEMADAAGVPLFTYLDGLLRKPILEAYERFSPDGAATEEG